MHTDLQNASLLRWGRRIEERFARPPPPPFEFDCCEVTFGFCQVSMRVTSVSDRCRLCFRLVFDEFDFFGPDASEKHFGSPGGIRESICGLLGCPGGSGRAAWRLLGDPEGQEILVGHSSNISRTRSVSFSRIGRRPRVLF